MGETLEISPGSRNGLAEQAWRGSRKGEDTPTLNPFPHQLQKHRENFRDEQPLALANAPASSSCIVLATQHSLKHERRDCALSN